MERGKGLLSPLFGATNVEILTVAVDTEHAVASWRPPSTVDPGVAHVEELLDLGLPEHPCRRRPQCHYRPVPGLTAGIWLRLGQRGQVGVAVNLEACVWVGVTIANAASAPCQPPVPHQPQTGPSDAA